MEIFFFEVMFAAKTQSYPYKISDAELLNI